MSPSALKRYTNDGDSQLIMSVNKPEPKPRYKNNIIKTIKKGNMKEIYSNLHEIVEKSKKSR